MWRHAADALSTHLDRVRAAFVEHPALQCASYGVRPHGIAHLLDVRAAKTSRRDMLTQALGRATEGLDPRALWWGWSLVHGFDQTTGTLTLTRVDIMCWQSDATVSWAGADLTPVLLRLSQHMPPHPVEQPYTVIDAAHACRAMAHMGDLRGSDALIRCGPDGIEIVADTVRAC